MGHAGRAQVIIVDDHPSFGTPHGSALTARGYDVVAEASCAATAMRAVERHDADAMLLDVHLGEDDGFAVCDAVTRVRPPPRRGSHQHDELRALRGSRSSPRRAGIHPQGRTWPRVDLAQFWQPA